MTTGKSNKAIAKLQRLTLLAIREANKSEVRQKHGAIVVSKGKIIASGFNKLKTHPKCQQEYQFLHAEEDALLRAGDDANGADLYVVRVMADGLGLSRPCETCMQVLQERGIRNVFYSTDNDVMEKIEWEP